MIPVDNKDAQARTTAHSTMWDQDTCDKHRMYLLQMNCVKPNFIVASWSSTLEKYKITQINKQYIKFY